MELELNIAEEDLSQKLRRYLTTALLILFVLQAATLPFALGYTLAGKDGKINQLVYHAPGRLVWESSQGIDPETGAALIDLFEVDPVTGKKIICPGMEGGATIRLVNPARAQLIYTAYVYRIYSNETLPVTATLHAAEQQPLYPPRGSVRTADALGDVEILDAIQGKMDGLYMRDITVSWQWDYYRSDLQDQMDTLCAQEDDRTVTLGVYIVVEDIGTYAYAVPQTGDSSQLGMYLAIMLISALLLVLLFIEWRIQHKWEEICEEP